MSRSTVSRRLTELRVVDLKNELDKRQLDKNGNKATLFSRLHAALINEGQDPEMFSFDVPDYAARRLKKEREGGIGEHDEDEEDDDSMSMETMETYEISPVKSEQLVNTSVTGIFKVPTPEEMEAKCPFTAEDTINLQNHPLHPVVLGDTLSTDVNADESTVVDLEQNDGMLFSEMSMQHGQIDEDEDEKERGYEDDEEIVADDDERLYADSIEVDASAECFEAEERSCDEPAVEGSPADSAHQRLVVEKDVQEEGEESSERDAANESSRVSAIRSLWISGISNTTRAADLKTLFSQYGTVELAKIVTHAKSPGSQCFGYIRMSSADEAVECIQRLHLSEFMGKVISIDEAVNEKVTPLKIPIGQNDKKAASSESSANRDTNSACKGEAGTNESVTGSKRDGRARASRSESRGRSRDEKRSKREYSRNEHRRNYTHDERNQDRDYKARTRSGMDRVFRRPVRGMYSRRYASRGGYSSRFVNARPRFFDEHFNREAELEKMRMREREHIQREEHLRLERERARLRADRERLEREKLELQQQKMRIAYERVPPPSNTAISVKRSFEQSFSPTKRPAYGSGPVYDSRMMQRERPGGGKRLEYTERDIRRSAAERYDYRPDHRSSYSGRGDHRSSRAEMNVGRTADGRRGPPSPRRGRSDLHPSASRNNSSWAIGGRASGNGYAQSSGHGGQAWSSSAGSSSAMPWNRSALTQGSGSGGGGGPPGTSGSGGGGWQQGGSYGPPANSGYGSSDRFTNYKYASSSASRRY
ncbi:SAFB-like transcription modulator [Trichinella pseudospiralis]|uniref:SAFB-like transcription modulator n=1 Tax=Trichinella pseudospiralis TaxID=6337 RepID=A0A0V1FW62_TRIPS|nr:SAFB-like transcription modulator [Trichinella pseudospiralis]